MSKYPTLECPDCYYCRYSVRHNPSVTDNTIYLTTNSWGSYPPEKIVYHDGCIHIFNSAQKDKPDETIDLKEEFTVQTLIKNACLNFCSNDCYHNDPIPYYQSFYYDGKSEKFMAVKFSEFEFERFIQKYYAASELENYLPTAELKRRYNDLKTAVNNNKVSDNKVSEKAMLALARILIEAFVNELRDKKKGFNLKNTLTSKDFKKKLDSLLKDSSWDIKLEVVKVLEQIVDEANKKAIHPNKYSPPPIEKADRILSFMEYILANLYKLPKEKERLKDELDRNFKCLTSSCNGHMRAPNGHDMLELYHKKVYEEHTSEHIGFIERRIASEFKDLKARLFTPGELCSDEQLKQCRNEKLNLIEDIFRKLVENFYPLPVDTRVSDDFWKCWAKLNPKKEMSKAEKDKNAPLKEKAIKDKKEKAIKDKKEKAIKDKKEKAIKDKFQKMKDSFFNMPQSSDLKGLGYLDMYLKVLEMSFKVNSKK